MWRGEVREFGVRKRLMQEIESAADQTQMIYGLSKQGLPRRRCAANAAFSLKLQHRAGSLGLGVG